MKKIGLIGGHPSFEIRPRVNVIFEHIRERISGMPHVQSVAAGISPPLSDSALGAFTFNFTIAGQSPVKQMPIAAWFPVSAGYIPTLGVPLLRGREHGSEDTARSVPSVVINETRARRFWPNDWRVICQRGGRYRDRTYQRSTMRVKSLPGVFGIRFSRCFLCHANRADLDAFACQIARVRNDCIAFPQTAGNLQPVAVIPADVDLL